MNTAVVATLVAVGGYLATRLAMVAAGSGKHRRLPLLQRCGALLVLLVLGFALWSVEAGGEQPRPLPGMRVAQEPGMPWAIKHVPTPTDPGDR